MRDRLTVAIIAHAGNQNLGDEALVAAVIDGVRRHAPAAVIRAFSLNPTDTSARHGIAAFPLRRGSPASEAAGTDEGVAGPRWRAVRPGLKRVVQAVPGLHPLLRGVRTGVRLAGRVLAEPAFLVASYLRLRGVDVLLVAGSQQLNDAYGGPWGFPYTLFKWSCLARLTGTEIAFLSVGAGPVSAPLSRWFVRRALSLARYRSYRDAISSRLVEGFGVRGANPVAPDLVYGLRIAPPPPPPPPRPREVRSPPLVGANPVPFYDGRYWPVDDPATYRNYVRTLAAFGDWLVDSGHRVLFFPTQLRADPLVIDDIRRAMRSNGHGRGTAAVVPGRRIASLGDLIAEIADTDIVVASRYHGILIALLLEKPVLGIAYHPKSLELMATMGQAEYAIEAARCEPDLLIERFRSLEARAAAVRGEIAGRLAALQDALERQYRDVLGVVRGGRR
jgi:polysaccharide pyruvyl transferase WcaK-like protein